MTVMDPGVISRHISHESVNCKDMSKPLYHDQEEFKNRSEKLSQIRALGIDPYPPTFHPSHTAQEIQAQETYAGSEEAERGETLFVTLAGRLVLFRAMGKNAFAQLQDSQGRIQLMFNRDHVQVTQLRDNEELSPFKFIEKKLDIGDIIGIEGHVFKTHKGETTVYVKKLTLLCKTLLPLAEKHIGLVDKEIRYRKRWLDLITHLDVAQTFRLRSQIIHHIRHYFEKEKFIEVETPILQNLYGGAEARPFITELHALHQQMYLRISLEIALKKLIVGGLERVYEISKVFRNEGLDRTHNPEFTMLEAYATYTDYNDMMVLTENLFESIAIKLFGSSEFKVQHQGEELILSLKAPWIRMSMKEAIHRYGHIDVDKITTQQLAEKLTELGLVNQTFAQSLPRGLLIAKLFETYAEPHLIQPHHIIDHPIETTPLCKPHRNPQLRKEGFVERFESFILGSEICNSYTELNDPELQRQLLVLQNEKREKGDEEAHPLDEEFIEAICQGMPPTGGLGIGIDRLVMLLTQAPSIRDVLFFPMMKPED